MHAPPVRGGAADEAGDAGAQRGGDGEGVEGVDVAESGDDPLLLGPAPTRCIGPAGSRYFRGEERLTRTRARGRCKACNQYICDACSADLFITGQCQSMRKRLDLAREEAALLEQRYGQSFNGTQILTSTR